jgi:phosphatidyl-myo-inositol dimannoside synthase
MQVLILSREFPPGPGGIGAHAFQLADNLNRLGWAVTVLTPQDYASAEEIREFNARQPFPVVNLPSRRGNIREGWHRWRTLTRQLRTQTPDVMVASGQRSVWLAAAAGRKFRLPWIAVGHGTEFGAVKGWQLNLTRWAFGRATAVVCVSQYTRALMLSRQIKPRLDVVIPNGADDRAFERLPAAAINEFRDQLKLDAEHLLLTVGNVTERKGQEVVIRSLPHVLAQCPKTHYLMCGLPTLQAPLTELARSLGVLNHVHFLGRLPLDQLRRHLNACDVFVMTSRFTSDGDCEGFGIAVVEAALCGKPAVVTGNSGLAEAIVEGQTGFTATENDPVSVANALLRLLRDSKLRLQMGEAAQKRAIEEQTWRGRAVEYDRVLRQITAPRAGEPQWAGPKKSYA